jgi:pyrimidine operon attenuation protein/uracil phosphoribosyltransferase
MIGSDPGSRSTFKPIRRGWQGATIEPLWQLGPGLSCAAACLAKMGEVFLIQAERIVLDSDQVRRALMRIGHEITERNGGANDLFLVGVHTRGVPLARRIAGAIGTFEDQEIPVASLDISLYRDDLNGGWAGSRSLRPSELPVDVTGRVVVLVDDVLYTGRSVRAAMDALMDLGRPRAIQLAVMVDRGHRELPIRADYVGKNVPTAYGERVQVRLSEVDGEDGVVVAPGD